VWERLQGFERKPRGHRSVETLIAGSGTSFVCHKHSCQVLSPHLLYKSYFEPSLLVCQHHHSCAKASQCDQPTMERLGLVLLLAQVAVLAASVHADQAVVTLYRKSSSLDPDSQRSKQNVVCEFHDILRTFPWLQRKAAPAGERDLFGVSRMCKCIKLAA
jgi:hypothetical protein